MCAVGYTPRVVYYCERQIVNIAESIAANKDLHGKVVRFYFFALRLLGFIIKAAYGGCGGNTFQIAKKSK